LHPQKNVILIVLQYTLDDLIYESQAFYIGTVCG
jgi:hypothetical protein